MRRTPRCRIIRTCGRAIVLRRGASRPLPGTSSDSNAMPQVPIIMPQLGDSIAEATVVQLLVKTGDCVAADQDVIEVETNKATMNVTSPCPGRVEQLLAKLNESYPVGAVLGYLEVTDEDAQRLGLDRPDPTDTHATPANGNGNKTHDTERKAV